jgi:hypothetical protein
MTYKCMQQRTKPALILIREQQLKVGNDRSAQILLISNVAYDGKGQVTAQTSWRMRPETSGTEVKCNTVASRQTARTWSGLISL